MNINSNMSEEQQESPRFKSYPNQLMPNGGQKFYLDEKSADVYFSIDDGDSNATRIAAHKILLAVGSDVFDAMFYGDLKENGDVNVVDASNAAFKEFLQYFYLSKVKLTEENIVFVIQLGHKYNVKKCVADSIKFLIDILDCENVWITLHLAILFESPELIKACNTFIAVNTDAVFKSNGFLECDKEVLEHILKMNVLSCDESEVFEACMAWVKAKSGDASLSKELVDIHLDQLYHEIRFKSMSIQQFCTLATKYDSVLRSDHFTLTNMIGLPDFQSDNFINRPRQADWNEQEVIKCDRAFNNETTTRLCGTQSITIFSTNKPLLLGGFICCKIGVSKTSPIRDLSSDLPVDVEILEANALDSAIRKNILKMKTNLQSKDTDVLLPHPVLIRPGFFYNLSIEHFPDDHCYYSKELKTTVQPKSDLTITFHHSQRTTSNKKIVGLVPILSFNTLQQNLIHLKSKLRSQSRIPAKNI